MAIFFHKVMFPFQANRNQKLGRNKYKLAAVIVFGKLGMHVCIIIVLLFQRVVHSITSSNHLSHCGKCAV